MNKIYRRCWFKIGIRDSLKDNMEIVLISLQKNILTMLRYNHNEYFAF